MRDESSQVASGLARVCADEPQMRATLAGDTSPLDRLITAVRDGAEISEPLDELHTALQRCGDALGVYGHGPRVGNFGDVRSHGLGDPRPVEVVFHCPQGTCARDWQPDPTDPPSTPPTCQVYGEPLRWTRLH